MVPRSKRLVYSVVSTAVTIAVCDIAICARYVLGNAAHDQSRFDINSPVWIANLIGGLFTVFPWVLLFCIPGWVLALPITLFVSRLGGLRFWMWWAAGTCIGPLVMYAVSFHYVHSYAQGRSTIAWNSWFSLATGVAGLATFLYLWLLRREQLRTVA